MLGIGGGGQHGVMAAGMEAKHDFGAGGLFDAQSLGADGHAAIARGAVVGGRARCCKRWPERKDDWGKAQVARRPGRHSACAAGMRRGRGG